MDDPDNKSSDGAPPRHIHIEGKEDKGTNWLPWLLLGLALLGLLFALSQCDRKEEAVVVPVDNTAEPIDNTAGVATAPLATERVTLPGGEAVDLAPATLNYELQRFLASDEAAPRTFTFDKLNFDTNSAAIRAEDQSTISALTQILKAYPNSKIKLAGYADARGGANANAKLGEQRAQAVATALTGAGIAANRVETATGGETNPVDSNATAEGQFENRRTDLIVTAK